MLVICYPQIGKVVLIEALAVQGHFPKRIDVETADIGRSPIIGSLEVDRSLTRDRVGILRPGTLHPDKEQTCAY